MSNLRKREKIRASYDELVRDAGDNIHNAREALILYREIKHAGTIPEIYFSLSGGYSIVDGDKMAIIENRMRHGQI